MIKTATVYLRRGKLYCYAKSKTTAGVWIATPPFHAVSPDNPADIGLAVRDALAASQEGIPHPKKWTGLLDPLYSMAAVRSWSQFVKGAESVGVEMRDESMVIERRKNLGAKEGFAPTSLQAVLPASVEPAALGEAVIQACTAELAE